MTIAVSYVMASYNHERYIAEMVRSILNQSVHDLELIIIDDGSTDKTLLILEEFAKDDPRIQLISQKNAGVVAARNRGIGLAQAELICLVDSDDLLSPDHAFHLRKAFLKEPGTVLAYGDAWLIDSNGQRGTRFSHLHPPVEGNFSVELFRNHCFVPAPAVMFKQSAMIASNLLWGAGATTDYLKWIELGLAGPVVRITGDPISSWRHHGENVSQSTGHNRATQYLDLIKDLKRLLEKHPDLEARIDKHSQQKRYAHCHFMAGYYFLLNKSWANAREHFWKSLTMKSSLKSYLGVLSTWMPMRYFTRRIIKKIERKRVKV